MSLGASAAVVPAESGCACDRPRVREGAKGGSAVRVLGGWGGLGQRVLALRDGLAYLAAGLVMYPAAPSEAYGCGGPQPFGGVDPATGWPALWELLAAAVSAVQVAPRAVAGSAPSIAHTNFPSPALSSFPPTQVSAGCIPEAPTDHCNSGGSGSTFSPSLPPSSRFRFRLHPPNHSFLSLYHLISQALLTFRSELSL